VSFSGIGDISLRGLLKNSELLCDFSIVALTSRRRGDRFRTDSYDMGSYEGARAYSLVLETPTNVKEMTGTHLTFLIVPCEGLTKSNVQARVQRKFFCTFGSSIF
jgi:hypothetical protein